MFVQSPPHGVSCWTNDEDNMTQLTARKDMQTYLIYILIDSGSQGLHARHELVVIFL